MAIAPLWVESHRPSSVANVIMTNEKHRKAFAEFVERGSIPNLLLHGGPGTGKTSISRALCRDLKINKSDIMTVRCSDEKIDAIRDRVKAFANTMPLGSFKIVRLEEFDNIGQDAQKLLRSLIEDCSATTRFIATANYVNRLLPEMRSRFQEFVFAAPQAEQLAERCMNILEAEKIKYDGDTLMDIIDLAYPDFRKIIQLLEASSHNGVLSLNTADAESIASWKFELLPLIDAGDWSGARVLVNKSASRDDIPEVFRFLYQNMHRCKKLKDNADQAIVTLAQYQYQHSFVADPEIQLAALFIELSNL